MDFKLNEFKANEEPKSRQIEELRVGIDKNEALLRQLKVSNAKDAVQLDEMEAQVTALYNEILSIENQCHSCDLRINQFKNAVHAVFTETSPTSWADELHKLHNTFVSRRKLVEEEDAQAETIEEFSRHKSALADKVIELRERVEDDNENTGSTSLKQIEKNQELISELTRLRDENHRLRSSLHVAEAELDTLLRQCGRESKQLETRMMTMITPSKQITQPVPTTQKKVTRSGTSMTVEHFT